MSNLISPRISRPNSELLMLHKMQYYRKMSAINKRKAMQYKKLFHMKVGGNEDDVISSLSSQEAHCEWDSDELEGLTEEDILYEISRRFEDKNREIVALNKELYMLRSNAPHIPQLPSTTLPDGSKATILFLLDRKDLAEDKLIEIAILYVDACMLCGSLLVMSVQNRTFSYLEKYTGSESKLLLCKLGDKDVSKGMQGKELKRLQKMEHICGGVMLTSARHRNRTDLKRVRFVDAKWQIKNKKSGKSSKDSDEKKKDNQHTYQVVNEIAAPLMSNSVSLGEKAGVFKATSTSYVANGRTTQVTVIKRDGGQEHDEKFDTMMTRLFGAFWDKFKAQEKARLEKKQKRSKKTKKGKK